MTTQATLCGAVLVVAFLLSGCETIPQSGLLYAQHTVGGLDLGVGDTTTFGAPITFGYKPSMGVYLPLAVKGDQIHKIIGTATLQFPTGDSAEARAAQARIPAAFEALIREGRYADAI